ncbi:MAG: hypothetical protein Q9196_004779 [Gyalolechia fulgens]
MQKLPSTVSPFSISSSARRRPDNIDLNDRAGELLSAVLYGSKNRKSRASQQRLQATPTARNSKGQKRKAYEPLVSSPNSRLKTNQNATEYIPAPEAARLLLEQDPNVPRQLLEKPKDSVMTILRGYAQLKPVFSKPVQNSPNTCTLHCFFPGGKQIATTKGRHRNRSMAEDAAYLHLAAECLHNEHLKPRLALLQIDNLDEDTLREERDAKSDIYNYAARFDAIPKIIETGRMLGNRFTELYEVTVTLLEQNIEVLGTGTNRRSAEIAAALRFKEAAEKYQAEHGDQSLVIKDSTALTTDNSGKFFDFYRIKHPGASIEVQHNQPAGHKVPVELLVRQGINTAQIALNGKLIGQAVSMSSKQKAQDAAFLTAAIELKKAEPELFPGFIRALAAGNGKILKPVAPVNMIVDEDCQLTMQETLLTARKAGLRSQIKQVVPDEQEASKPRPFRRRLSPSELERRSRDLVQRQDLFMQNPRLAELRRQKEGLPMNQHRAHVLDLVSNNSYSIIVGATGSGKSTQVPQIVLEDAITRGSGASCNVVCTQPRRIAATSVARRVAAERAEQLQETVGYHVRFDAKLPSNGGSITYCTTGILLQQLQRQPDEVMDGVSHIVVDEVHERDIQIDFLLILLKKAMNQRAAAGKSTPKVVLMSATMNTELFASYFETRIEGKGTVACPSLSVPGRAFPVKEKYLEEITSELRQSLSREALSLLQGDPATADYFQAEQEFKKHHTRVPENNTEGTAKSEVFAIDWKSERKRDVGGAQVSSTEADDSIVPFGLVATTIAHISKTTDQGAILVFLPGLEEIIKVEELLYTYPFGLDFKDGAKYQVCLLHSSIPAGQTDVFNEMPAGCRKIILSTNIAETSVTIPDVQYVVDTGKLREKQYDQLRRITHLKCTWISKSNAKQRAGRAGRVQNGNYYALYSAERYHSFRAAGLPEMLRMDLQELCLDIKAQSLDYPIRNFLAEALEPPSSKTVDASVKNLQALDALTAAEEITPLGRLLASLPVNPSLGKMIILGVIFRCLDPMLVIGAAAEERSLFISPLDHKLAARQSKLSFTRGSASDHLGTLNAVREMRRLRDTRREYEMRQYAIQNFIHVNAFKTIDKTAQQIENILVEAGLVPYTPDRMRNRSEYGDPSLNENSLKVPLIKALAVAGFHPNLSVATGGKVHRTPGEAHTIVHPSSVNSALRHGQQHRFGALHTYTAMARSNDGNSVYLRDTTECTPLQAALFGGKLALRANTLEMDDWLSFFVRANSRRVGYGQTMRIILEFRAALDQLLAGTFMDLKGRKEKNVAKGEYLADHKARAVFAEGLVDVLDQDAVTAAREMERDERGRPVFTFGKDPRRNADNGAREFTERRGVRAQQIGGFALGRDF